VQNLSVASHPGAIAVVDDDMTVCTALWRLLSAYGYRVHTFTSAADFLSSGKIEDVACLMLDIQLGDRSGLDLAHELTASGYCGAIIFMTGSKDEEIRRRCLDFGCSAFLQKPIFASKLVGALTAAIPAEPTVLDRVVGN